MLVGLLVACIPGEFLLVIPAPGVTRNALACYLWKSIDVPKRRGAIDYLLDWFLREL